MKKGLVGFLALSTLFSFAVVSHSQKVEVAAESSFVKVTENLTDWSGTYLIVNETAKVALDGSLSTIDAQGNYFTVTIDNGTIAYDESLEAKAFTIEATDGGYKVKSASGLYIGATKNKGNSLLSNASYSNSYLNTISYSDGKVLIKGVGTSENIGNVTLQYFNNSGQERFRYYHTQQQAVNLYKLSDGSVEPETPVEPEDKTEEVTALFTEYYGEGTYTKDSVLNTNKIADAEVKKYFHAGADTKYRRTEYYPEGLTMTTSTDGSTYSNESIYTNDNGQVKHTGLGGSFTVNQPSVEDWFVTLKDFKDSTLEGWVLENGVYTYALEATTATTEHEMTRMAREFVAPMWLAPNAVNYSYAIFDKLTVQEVNNQLVMKLYVAADYSGILETGSDLVFSQVTISKPTPDVVTNIADALEAEVGTSVVLTGTVSKIYYDYSEQYGNISVYITDDSGKQILAYQMKGKVYSGDKITVSGVIAVYNDTNQIGSGCTYTLLEAHTCTYGEATCEKPSSCTICNSAKDDILGDHNYVSGTCAVCGEVDPSYSGPVVEKETVSLDLSNKSNRTSFSTSQQVWKQNGIVITNNKGSSTSNVADYAPARFYKNSEVIVEMEEGNVIESIEFTCNGSSYATSLKNSIGSAATVVVSGSVVKVTLSGNSTSFTVKLTDGQVRMGNTVKVTYQK